MSKANRTNRPNSQNSSKTRFLRSRQRLVFLSKPVIKNPEWKDDPNAVNLVPQFIVAPVKGRTYRKSEGVIHGHE